MSINKLYIAINLRGALGYRYHPQGPSQNEEKRKEDYQPIHMSVELGFASNINEENYSDMK